jgi:hypothetical protein
MDCKKVKEQLPLYMDEQLDEKAQEEIRAHLDSCDDCQLVLHQLCKMADHLGQIPHPEIPKEFSLRFRRALKEEILLGQKESLEGHEVKSSSRWWKRWSVVAAVFLVGILSIYGFNQDNGVPEQFNNPQQGTILSIERDLGELPEEEVRIKEGSQPSMKDTEREEVDFAGENSDDLFAMAGTMNEEKTWQEVQGTPEEEIYYLEVLQQRENRNFVVKNSFKDEEETWHFLIRFEEETLSYEGKDGEIWISE